MWVASDSDAYAITTNATTGTTAIRQLPRPTDGDSPYWRRIATSIDRADPGGPNDGRTVVAASSKNYYFEWSYKCVLHISNNFGVGIVEHRQPRPLEDG